MSKIKQKVHYISKYLEDEGQISPKLGKKVTNTSSPRKIYLNLAIKNQSVLTDKDTYRI